MGGKGRGGLGRGREGVRQDQRIEGLVYVYWRCRPGILLTYRCDGCVVRYRGISDMTRWKYVYVYRNGTIEIQLIICFYSFFGEQTKISKLRSAEISREISPTITIIINQMH